MEYWKNVLPQMINAHMNNPSGLECCIHDCLGFTISFYSFKFEILREECNLWGVTNACLLWTWMFKGNDFLKYYCQYQALIILFT